MKKFGLMLLAALMIVAALWTSARAESLAPLSTVHGMFYIIPGITGKFTDSKLETCSSTVFLIRYNGVNKGSAVPQNMGTILMTWHDVKEISQVFFPYKRQPGDKVVNVAYTTLAGLPACYLEYDWGNGSRNEQYILAAEDGYFNINLYTDDEFAAECRQVNEEFIESLDNRGNANKPDPKARAFVDTGKP